MIKEAIEKILELAKPEEVTAFDQSGRTFMTRPIHPVKPPHPAPLELSTLIGIVDTAVDLADDLPMVHIVGPDRVDLISDFDSAWLERHTFASAKARACAFPFDRQMDVETFLINLQLHFEDTSAKADILRFVSHLSTNEVRLASDDGLSQTATVKTEIGRRENATITPVQYLRPIRTFREIAQPEGQFLLRLYPGRGELPQVALHQAEGAAWRDEAIASIYTYLRAALPAGVAILR